MKISEFAKKCGVTVKTLLHYEKIGLLEPSGRNEKGYRIYCENDFLKLQQITTLKYIGLPLKEIKKIICDNNENLEQMIKIQKEALEEKRKHIDEVIKVFNKAEKQAKETGTLDAESLINVIKITNMESTIKDQYKDDKNLNVRNNLYSYNINNIDWDKWCFNNMKFKDYDTVLEIGCGNGKFWYKNKDNLNNSMEITLSDFSKKIVKSAKDNINDIGSNFKFEVINAENIPYDDESFDIVIAEHVLYFITDMSKALSEIKRVLKKDGVLYATTNSINTMKELNILSEEFAPKSGFSNNMYADRFNIENGSEILNRYFSEISLKSFEGKIVIDKAEPVVSYKASTVQGKNVLDAQNKKKFTEFLEEYIKKNNNIKITTKSGMFICRKQSSINR